MFYSWYSSLCFISRNCCSTWVISTRPITIKVARPNKKSWTAHHWADQWQQIIKKTNYSYEMSETVPGETYVANIIVFDANWCIFLSNKSNAYTTGKEYPENGFLDDSASPFYTWHKNEVYCLHRSTSAQWCRSWDAGISNSTPKVFWFVKNLGKIRKNLCKEFWYFLTILN